MKEGEGEENGFDTNGLMVWAAFEVGGRLWKLCWQNDCDGCFCGVVMSPYSYCAPVLHRQLLYSSESLPGGVLYVLWCWRWAGEM